MPHQQVIVEILLALLLVAVGATLAGVWGSRRASKRVAGTMRVASDIVGSAIAGPGKAEGLDGMAARLARLFDAEACVVALPTDDGRLYCGATYGYPDPVSLFVKDDEGVTGAVYSTGRPIVADVKREPRFIERLPGMRFTIAVPLRHQDQIMGVFALESSSRRYRGSDLAILEPLAEQIAAVLTNQRLRIEAEARAAAEERASKELRAISSVVMAGVASSSDLDAALHSMIREISSNTGWESMAVILYAPDGLLYTSAYYGYPLHSTVIAFHPGQGIIGSVAQQGVGRLVNDVTQDPDYLDVVSETMCEMCVPLYVGDRVIGVLNAESPRPGAFDDDDFRLLGTLARQMAVVIERARLSDIERKAHERLQEADQLKEDFIATVSHELRTPLTSIKGYAQTLLAHGEALSTEDRASFLDVMVRQCDRLAEIVETLLLASRLESGDTGGKPSFVGLTDLLRTASEGATGSSERVITRSPSGVGIITDPFRACHIVRNLIENACKYSPHEAPVLVTGRVEDGHLWVEVVDQGAGIPEGFEERIFDRFKRLSDPGDAPAPGTGLGLYIARRFARDLGGDVTVGRGDETPWTGARFSLWLPASLEMPE